MIRNSGSDLKQFETILVPTVPDWKICPKYIEKILFTKIA